MGNICSKCAKFFAQLKPKKRKDPMVLNINDLPQELLVKIFNDLDLRSKLRAQRVCKLWSQLIFENNSVFITIKNDSGIGDNWRIFYSKEEEKDFNGYPFCKNPIEFSKVIQKFHRLRNVSIYITNEVLDTFADKFTKILQMIAENCESDLKRLSFTSKVNTNLIISKSDADVFTEKYPNLETLCLKTTTILITEDTIETLVKNLKKLRVFELLKEIRNEENEGYSGHSLQYMNPCIEVLNSNGLLLNENSILLMANNQIGNQLRKLEIIGLRDDNSLELIGKHFKSMESLKCITNPEDINTFDMKDVFKNISKLENLFDLELNFYNPWNDDLLSISFSDIQYLNNCPKLESICLKGFYLTNDSIESIANYVPNLSSLKLEFIVFIGDSEEEFRLLPIERIFAKLKILSLKEIYPKPEFYPTIEILKNCIHLQILNIYFGEDFTLDSVYECISFAEQRPQLLMFVFIPLWFQLMPGYESWPKNLVFIQFDDF